MKKIAGAAAAAMMLAGCAQDGALVLRDMGSFHVGGRIAEVSGKPVMEVRRTPGGPPTKVDPNGTYQVEQAYAQYFLPANRRGTVPLLLWHGRPHRGVLRDHARWPAGLAEFLRAPGLGHV